MKTHPKLAAALIVGMLAMGARVADGRQINTPQRPVTADPSRPLGEPARDNDPFSTKIAEQQARNRNSDRQKKLVADTDKLLSLATELKQQVDKTDKNTLSVDVVKKADEIEKLAHSVKEKMKGGV